jgi:hypothetical protein
MLRKSKHNTPFSSSFSRTNHNNNNNHHYHHHHHQQHLLNNNNNNDDDDVVAADDKNNDEEYQRQTRGRRRKRRKKKKNSLLAQEPLSSCHIMIIIVLTFFISLFYHYYHHHHYHHYHRDNYLAVPNKAQLQHNPFNQEQISSTNQATATATATARTPSILHIVNTRFMQNQPNLTTLATARLHLFQTFCLPSMIHQSIHHHQQQQQQQQQQLQQHPPSLSKFIWIIKIDPNLEMTITKQLIELVDPFYNFYIVKSNINYMVGTKPGSWRDFSHDVYNNKKNMTESQSLLQNIQNDEVLTGDLNLLRQYIRKGANIDNNNNNNDDDDDDDDESCILLETRLDADDGLNRRYLEFIQRDAKRLFLMNSTAFVNNENDDDHNLTTNYGSNNNQNHHHVAATTTNTKWYFWCIEKHAKWYPSKGHERGKISGERRLDFCITPGLTVGFNIGTTSEEVPYYDHNTLYYNLVANRNTANKSSSISNSSAASKNSLDNKVVSKTKQYDCGLETCLSFITQMVGAVRSRTVTSAGMEDTSHDAQSKLEMDDEMTNWIWNKLQTEFHISMDDVIDTNLYLQEHATKIAKDNLSGQCTDGHSCKKGAQDRLKRVIQYTEKV